MSTIGDAPPLGEPLHDRVVRDDPLALPVRVAVVGAGGVTV